MSTQMTDKERMHARDVVSRMAVASAYIRELLKTDHWPSDDELKDAPLIDEWVYGQGKPPGLVGWVGDKLVHTSPVLVRGPHAALTLNRWYRLGRRKSDDPAVQQ